MESITQSKSSLTKSPKKSPSTKSSPTKKFLFILGIVFICFCIAFLSLNQISKTRISQAHIQLLQIDSKAESKATKQSNKSPNISFSYQAKLIFSDNLFRFQNNFSNIEIVNISWNQNLDSAHFRDIYLDGRILHFTSPQQIQDNRIQDNKAKHTPDDTIQNNTTQTPIILGTLSYKTHFLISFFWTMCLYFVVIIFLWFAGLQLFKLSQNFRQNLPQKLVTSAPPPLEKKDIYFLIGAFLLCAFVCGFTFWLGFPGYHIIGDTYYSIALIKSNWHPVFISYVLQFLYIIFGKHLYYLFLFNLIPFYCGIFFLMAGFYLRFKAPILAIALILISGIGNIYFQNFVQYHSFSLPMMLFCMYSMILFLSLVNLRSKALTTALWICVFIIMFFALLWRHNAIFSVFPAFFVICYIYLQGRDLSHKAFVKKYIALLCASAILALSIVIIIPKLLSHGVAYPTNPTFLHQIAGACVSANDESCFKPEWYMPNKTFEDVKNAYQKYPTSADVLNVPWWNENERVFKHERLKGLHTMWIQAILKYPKNFLHHELRFIKAMWIQNPGWIFNAQGLQDKGSHPWHAQIVQDFPENEKNITLSPLQERIYSALYANLPRFNHIYGVSMGTILLLISSILLCLKRFRNALLVFTFSVSFASFFSALFIALFTPVNETRYMSLVLPLSIVALLGFIAFLYTMRTEKVRS